MGSPLNPCGLLLWSPVCLLPAPCLLKHTWALKKPGLSRWEGRKINFQLLKKKSKCISSPALLHPGPPEASASTLTAPKAETTCSQALNTRDLRSVVTSSLAHLRVHGETLTRLANLGPAAPSLFWGSSSPCRYGSAW